MNLKDLVNNRDVLSNAGIFMAFSAFSFLSFSIVSPIVSSNADTNTASVTVGPYTTSISADAATAIDITPTSSQAVYTGTNTITYTNTCPYGFNVTASSTSSDTNLTRTGTDSGIKTISSTTGTTLVNNSWGLSIDGGTTYMPVPAVSNPTNVINTFEATTNPATLNLMYGVKTDNTLPSGNYTNDLIYTVSVKPQCLTYEITWDYNGGTAASGATYPTELNFGVAIDLSVLTPTKTGYVFTGWSNGTDTFTGAETSVDINTINSSSLTMTAQWQLIPSMQDFSCDTLNPGSSVLLRDARDNKTYTVKKLDDGRCWMTQNLRLIDKTISSADSNLPEGETWTIPASSISGFSAQNTNNAYLDSTYGGYYTFYTATAGWGTNSVTSGNAPKDICPKGWRLPISNEYQRLYDVYNSSALMQGDPGLVLSGLIYDGSFEDRGRYGSYWSSTVRNAPGAYLLNISSSSVGPTDSDGKSLGLAIRCVADMDVMQGFDSSTLSAGESKVLEDIRDGKIYTVKKLDDGRVWMTENLGIVNKTISSADSDLPSGTTYTIPASDLSGFTDFNTSNAYYDSEKGGYYNFYTATAGWGTNTITSGESPMSICPKGWRLPTSSEYGILYSKYNSSALLRGVPGFIMGGYIDNGVFLGTNEGRYWSSTVYQANNVYGLYFNDGSSASPSTSLNKYRGNPVHCIVDETMQGYNTTQLANTGDAIVLTDTRDGNKYTVKKLADGKVWMTENLRLINKTISSADSNLPSGETWTVPASSTSGFDYQDNDAYLDSIYGGYYTFYAATAGWGTSSVSSGNSPKDICPKGWRLPTSGPDGEFQTLSNYYNPSDLVQGAPNFTLSGSVYYSTVYDQGEYGEYWSSTVHSGNHAYQLGLNGSNTYPASNHFKSTGFSVRCVAKDTMQKFDKSTLVNTGDSAYLEDERDGNMYTVKKLADGNVWMTENLRIANKTITPADSNVTSDFTIPASSTSGFRDQDTNNAYVDSTYGGYYTFYTATAGTGGTSLTSGNAPSSICPKGWRLPTGGSSSELQTLYNSYNSSALMQGVPGFTLSGVVTLGQVLNRGVDGYFWSSSVYEANRAYRLGLSSSDVDPASNSNKLSGFSLRCLAQ